MGTGTYYRNRGRISVYVLGYFNKTKYLKPELCMMQFMSYISRHLPREYQVVFSLNKTNSFS